MKPSEMMRQMKALLPPDSNAGRYFMSAFLHRLPADMIDHIISQDFKDCTKMAEYADKLYARRRGNAVSGSPINAVSGGRRRENSPDDRRRRSPSRQGRSLLPPALRTRPPTTPHRPQTRTTTAAHVTLNIATVAAGPSPIAPVVSGPGSSTHASPPLHSRAGSSHLHSRRAGDAPLRRSHRSARRRRNSGAAATVSFSLPPTAPPTTTSTSSASGRPLHAARPPNRLNL
jgi:hypothetical protein